MADELTAADARHWAMLTRAVFAARRLELDALNVFPVPDGDTGTNLYLTFDGALDDVIREHTTAGILGTASLVQECANLSRALLMAARGNSGVILSQLVGGLCRYVVDGGFTELDARQTAAAFALGAQTARAGVREPKEGTILSVADAGAEAALAAADRGAGLVEVLGAAVAAAERALEHTPEQLPELKAAGVVDAGGAGCLLMLEALHRVVTGDWSLEDELALGGGEPPLQRRAEWHLPGAVAPSAAVPVPRGGAPAYEVMFLLDNTDSARVEVLGERLAGLGDSLIVVGGPDLYNVHVHVDDAGAAVEAGFAAGRPHRVRITYLEHVVESVTAGLGVVACSAGPGITAVLEGAGATVVPSVPGARASAGQLLAAARATGAACVIIVPGDRDTLMAAEVAAKSAAADGIEAYVVPAHTTVQGLAAVAVHDPSRPAQSNLMAMSSAASATRNGAVTVATKEALTWAGVCRPGDVLGVIDGDIAFLDTTVPNAAFEVLRRLLAGGGELVTLVLGADADADDVDAITGWLASERPEVEVEIIEGGQPVYPVLLGVE